MNYDDDVEDALLSQFLFYCPQSFSGGGLYSNGNGLQLLLLLLLLLTGGKSGGELLTLFDSYSYDGVSAGIYGSYIHTGGKSGGELLTLFDSYSYDGVSAGIWVIHTYRWQIWG